MSPAAIILTICAYFALMFVLSYLSGRGSSSSDFFTPGKKSGWFLVAFAMIGSAFSGVTFVSVPGMVAVSGFGYLQMCLGFIAGYLVIAYVLVPLYFRLKVVSIYQYLEQRFGEGAYKTGAWFFFISKLLGASVRLFLVCQSLQLLVFDPLGLPFALNSAISAAIIFAYTFKGGVKTVIWTDVLKTGCMIVALLLSIFFIFRDLGTIDPGSMTKVFFFDDPKHPQFFFKQFFGGLFTVVAMTGLDQDMMQRTLCCKNAKDSQKNLISTILMQTFVISLLLFLGVLLYNFAAANGISQSGDKLFPAVATSGSLPLIVGVLFILGIVSSAYGSGGSALTALTVSFTVDILGTKDKTEEKVKKTRQIVHVCIAVAIALLICAFSVFNNTSTIDAVYTLASYTYGPILGMFSFGIFCKRKIHDRFVPLVALIAPLLCFVLQSNSPRWFGGYRFSYELLIFNALFVIAGLFCLIKKDETR